MLVNNRPDGEEAGQPLASEIEEAAAEAGIAYRFVPIIRGIGPADVEAMQEALREADDGKLLAFCRSGTRSALVCALAHREEGSQQGRGPTAACRMPASTPARSRTCSSFSPPAGAALGSRSSSSTISRTGMNRPP